MATQSVPRSALDRRRDEIGPPRGWKERRCRSERRMLNIEECVMSESEWLSYFGASAPAVQNSAPQTANEVAAEIFSRVRD